MKYAIVFEERVLDNLVEWAPPESVLDELERRVEEQLAANPVQYLTRLTSPQGPSVVMQYNCPILQRSPETPGLHHFLLRVIYDEDEKTLRVWDMRYYPPA